MSLRSPRFGLLLVVLVVTACDRTNVTLNSPTALADTFVASSAFGFQPATLQPEFLPLGVCLSVRPFGTRIIIVVNGSRDVILRGLRFRFTDRFGVNALPLVAAINGASPLPIPAPAVASAFPVSTPGVAPLPVTSAIPMAGSTPSNGMLVPAGSSRSLPFFLSFGCGVAPEGMLFVSVDESDANGRMHTSELRARLAAYPAHAGREREG